ncbi:MAG TPA: hypothetical protein DCS43_09525 [Verrucomicrobia bacterium]|nr:hypothetical protein [Verrucomicrobiota bacterium]
MPRFYYKAVGTDGASTSGTFDAADATAVRRGLREKKLTPISVQALDAGASSTPKTSREVPPRNVFPVDRERLLKESISRSDADKISLAFFAKLHQLVVNGMPLGDAVKALSQRLTVPRLKTLSGCLWHELSRGTTMGHAMQTLPNVFDPTTIAMIEAGEATGNVAPILANIIEMIDGRRRLRKEVLTGLAYPAFLLGMVVCVMLFVLFYLMPNVQSMMTSMGGELSLPTRLVMGFAKFSLTGGPFLIGITVGAVLLIRQWRKTPGGRLITDRKCLSLPGIRTLVRNAELARLCNLTAVLLASGVDTTVALRLIERAVRNEHLRVLFNGARVFINDGLSFADALRRQELLPDMDLDVLSISEDAGDLVAGFRSIHQVRQEELREQLKRMTVWIGTGSLIFVFVLVALLVFGILSSILQLSRSVLG